MNKVVASAGLLALGAAAVYGYDPEMTRARSGRPFTVSATVRGFYDDNPTSIPDTIPNTVQVNRFTAVRQDIHPEGSFGFEVSPAVHVNLPLEQTFIRMGYVYSFRYFEERTPDNIDQSHEFNGLLRHAFSPRHDIAVSDSFILTREPTVLDKGGIVTTPVRSNEDALHNYANLKYNLALTDLVGLGLGYANDWYDYNQEGLGSRSALLDRLQHAINADLRYQLNPSLIALVGYQLGLANYIGDEFIYASPDLVQADLIAQGMPPAEAFEKSRAKSDIRDSVSHFVYLGADHDFNHKLRGSARGGVQIVDYVNTEESNLSPYVDASLTYVYLPDCSLTLGLRHQRYATDISSPDSTGTPTLDQEATAGYLQVQQRITTDLSGSLLFQVQHSTFSSGAADNQNELFYTLGLNLTYRFDYHWAVEVGYNFDLLDSDLTTRYLDGKQYDVRSFDRSRVYLGVRASY